MTQPQQPPSLAKRGLAVVVGLFVMWQLVYMPAANLIGLVPRRPGPPLEPLGKLYREDGTFTRYEPLQRTAERAGYVLDSWAELSGQEQGWSLFTPGTPPYSVFLAVEFHWANNTSDTLLSQYEPADYVNPPMRTMLVYNRTYNFDMHFAYPVWYAAPDVVARHPDRWANLPEVVYTWRSEIRTWLGWRWKHYLALHPNREQPRAIVLKHRYISTPKPGEPRDTPRTVTERPYARWSPGDDTLEAFDVTTMRFVPARAKP